MQEKRRYQAPEAKRIEFEAADVLTTSGLEDAIQSGTKDNLGEWQEGW